MRESSDDLRATQSPSRFLYSVPRRRGLQCLVPLGSGTLREQRFSLVCTPSCGHPRGVGPDKLKRPQQSGHYSTCLAEHGEQNGPGWAVIQWSMPWCERTWHLSRSGDWSICVCRVTICCCSGLERLHFGWGSPGLLG